MSHETLSRPRTRSGGVGRGFRHVCIQYGPAGERRKQVDRGRLAVRRPHGQTQAPAARHPVVMEFPQRRQELRCTIGYTIEWSWPERHMLTSLLLLAATAGLAVPSAKQDPPIHIWYNS